MICEVISNTGKSPMKYAKHPSAYKSCLPRLDFDHSLSHALEGLNAVAQRFENNPMQEKYEYEFISGNHGQSVVDVKILSFSDVNSVLSQKGEDGWKVVHFKEKSSAHWTALLERKKNS
jgi:hypothetical protein